ncbi:hypothetical protein [Nostoc sp. 'Peltigera membranacea cyanobiont' 232]|uniref:hypothetical protein n=1 Tax=Nostoc sp. 'Peltigera membranacea cyanobiont' 232 TaxID=2014531 RepID=UPI000B95655D|nr:hypothetical protein [Nostoc sp. 'Peltigera membranacea cyanobiont' 232]OYD98880.1 hypothetical protein CDG79_40005 [Nostoc sp. 'Peltigera membranacea cyanobiont' 232]
MKIDEYPQITNASSDDILLIETASDSAYKSIKKSDLLSGISSSGGVYPTSFSHWHDESTVVVGASLTYDYASYAYGTATIQLPPATNDTFKFNAPLDAGTYAISFLVSQANNRGIGVLHVNGTAIAGSIDLYSGSFVGAAIVTKTVTITTPGIQEFQIVVTGKNASSANYYFVCTKIWGVKQ